MKLNAKHRQICGATLISLSIALFITVQNLSQVQVDAIRGYVWVFVNKRIGFRIYLV